MPRSLGSALPAELVGLLDGADPAGRIGLTFLLLTTDPDGWSHAAMLSVGEVLASGTREVRLGLWPGSSTTANLERAGVATLLAVLPPASWHVRLRCNRGSDIAVGSQPRSFFRCAVEEVFEDVVAYATITHGIEFELNDAAAIVEGWQAGIEAMRQAGLSDSQGNTSQR